MQKLDYEKPEIEITDFVTREDIMSASMGGLEGGGTNATEPGGGIDIGDL